MAFYRWKTKTAWQACVMSLSLIPLFLLAACGGPNAAPASPQGPQAPQGQQLLTNVAQKLSSAQSLHGMFNLSTTEAASNGPPQTGTAKFEVWEAAAKNRTVVLQSSLAQFTTGTVTVTNGKQVWLYDPAKKVAYTGQVTPSATPPASTGTPTAGTGTSTIGSTNTLGQSLSPTQLLLSTFTGSDSTLTSSSATLNGHTVYDVHVVSQSKDDTGTPDYTGEVYIDKTTELPVQVSLTLQDSSKSVLDILMLTLNQTVPNSTFVFTAPAGVKVLPFPKTSVSNSSTTLAQAEKQAGFHLLSIPKSQTAYVLKSISAISAAQIYTLSYTMGTVNFTLVQGKALAGQESTLSGSPIKVRGVTGALQTTAPTELAWTENGVGIYISGKLTKNQFLAIAQSLS